MASYVYEVIKNTLDKKSGEVTTKSIGVYRYKWLAEKVVDHDIKIANLKIGTIVGQDGIDSYDHVPYVLATRPEKQIATYKIIRKGLWEVPVDIIIKEEINNDDTR